jgi:hypothetical protein
VWVGQGPKRGRYVRAVLFKAGSSATTANTAAAEFEPGLVVLDVLLPNMDGFMLAQRFHYGHGGATGAQPAAPPRTPAYPSDNRSRSGAAASSLWILIVLAPA